MEHIETTRRTMRLMIEVTMDNDAFAPDEGLEHVEAARILRELATGLDERGPLVAGEMHKLYDVNGNSVGGWYVR